MLVLHVNVFIIRQCTEMNHSKLFKDCRALSIWVLMWIHRLFSCFVFLATADRDIGSKWFVKSVAHSRCEVHTSNLHLHFCNCISYSKCRGQVMATAAYYEGSGLNPEQETGRLDLWVSWYSSVYAWTYRDRICNYTPITTIFFRIHYSLLIFGFGHFAHRAKSLKPKNQ